MGFQLCKKKKLSKTPFEDRKMFFTVRISVYDNNIPRAPPPSRARSGRKVKKKE